MEHRRQQSLKKDGEREESGLGLMVGLQKQRFSPDELSAVSKTAVKPKEGCVGNASIGESNANGYMRDCVKSCTLIQKVKS